MPSSPRRWCFGALLCLLVLLVSTRIVTTSHAQGTKPTDEQPSSSTSGKQKPLLTQREDGERPNELAQGAQPLDQVEQIEMPPVDVRALREEDQQRLREGLPPRFAQPIAVDIRPVLMGTWEVLPNGAHLWRLRIASPGAISLNLGFTRYHMPAEGRLFLYTPDYTTLIGPFTDEDNEVHGQLWTPLLEADEIVIEVVLPGGDRNALELDLSSVNHGYQTLERALRSGSCNVDVACSEGDDWRDEMRSVAVYSLGGNTFCTGALVNNTAQDLKPYFLTADHCGVNTAQAPSLVTYWNYQNSTCRPPGSPESGGAGDGSLSQFNTGAIFRAEYGPSDMTLLELDDPLNPAFDPHWAGWDATNTAPASAVAIHHPNTDEMRISFENDPTSITSYLGSGVPGDGTHLRVADWDLGTTEPGSSGSPLFNPDHRIVGQLHGGYAACGNDDSDWYGRLYTSWTGGGTQATRLSDWLDPLGINTLVLDGRDTAPDFTLVATPPTLDICAPTEATFNVAVGQQSGFSDVVSLSATGHPAGTTTSFSPNNQAAPYASVLTVGNTTGASAGSYTLTIEGVSGSLTHSDTVQLNLFTAAPSAPTLTSPANGTIDVSPQTGFSWSPIANATSYTVQLATDPNFNNIVVSETTSGTSFTPATPLDNGTAYYWRVQAVNPCSMTSSETFAFVTATPGATATTCSNPNVNIPDDTAAGVSDDLVYTGTSTIADLDVAVTATHTWVGDLTFTLQHVNTSTSVTIIDRPGRTTSGAGCSGDNIDATLDDEAASPVENVCAGSAPTISGRFQPNNPLSTFDGQSLQGTWRMTASDQSGMDTGKLISWCLVATNATPADYSDLPVSYGAAWHTGDGTLRLGTNRRNDTTFVAESDNSDDDGVLDTTIPTERHPGGQGSVVVTITGGSGFVAGWYDWNNNGTFEAGEKMVAAAVTPGVTAFLFTIPNDAVTEQPVNARFRLYPSEPTHAPTATESPLGGAAGGEVEDHTLDALPLSVALAGFNALVDGEQVILAWETLSEMGNTGFNLYRATDAEGPGQRLNDALIASEGPNSSEGFSYQWVDFDVQVGTTYFYWLESVSTTGAMERHGPVSAAIQVPTSITLGTLSVSPAAAPVWGLLALAFTALAGVLLRRRR